MSTKYFKLWQITFVGLFILLISGTSQCLAASFLADMVEIKKRQRTISKFYLYDNLYRIDVKEGRLTLTMLVDRESGKTRVLNPSQKAYRELNNDDMMSLIKNPFESYQHMVTNDTVIALGKEIVNNIVCDKQAIEKNGTKVMTVWLSSKHNFPIKILNNLNGDIAELQGVREIALEPDFFKVPADFVKVQATKPQSAEPKKKIVITGKETFKAPIGRRIGPGGVLSVTVSPEKHIHLKFYNENRGESEVVINRFKNNIPITVKSLRNKIIGLKKIMETKELSLESLPSPDSLEITVTKGMVYVIVNQESPMWEKEQSQEYFIKKPAMRSFLTKPRQKIIFQLTGDNQDKPESKLTVTFFKDKYNTTPLLSEEISLKNGQSRQWEFDADHKILSGLVKVKQGSVQSSLYQPVNSPAKAKQAAQQTISKTKSTARQKTATQKTDPARMVLVLDASGSMWGQIEGKSKIAIAKEVMAELVDAIPSNFYTGLTVYGHRRKGDCKDIEMLIPVSPHNASSMKAKINAISPKGKTPLSESVRQAALALRHEEERATVILVSDGLETCNVDPCKLADELAMTGVDFTIHVVGFGISKEEQAHLKCLADKTGGLFLAADNAAALRDALFKTVEKVREAPLPVIEEPGMAELNGPGTAPAGASFEVTWQGPDSRNDYIAIAAKGSHDAKRDEYSYTETGNPVVITAPGEPGKYELRYVYSHSHKVIGRTDIEITPVEAQLKVPVSVKAGSDFGVTWEGPGYENDFLTIAVPDAAQGQNIRQAHINKQNSIKMTAPGQPGDYEVRYILFQDRKIIARASLKVEAVSASISPPASADIGSEIMVPWQGPGNYDDMITLARPGMPGDRDVGSRAGIRSGNPVKIQVPGEPGEYEIRYILFQDRKIIARASLKVEAVSASVSPPASAYIGSKIMVPWQGPGNYDDMITLARPGMPGDRDVGSRAGIRSGNPVKIRLPGEPGEYEIRYILFKGRKILAATPVTLKPATASIKAPAQVKAGTDFLVEWEGPGGWDDFLTIALPSQSPDKYVKSAAMYEKSPVKMRAPSEPGTYEVRYILFVGRKLLGKATIQIIP